jgi:7,8-dihydropterin-6-yl-methyl-4-(beta-D-ribofuranosyl)aminobenzene 5'-phosphate synthase
MNVTVLFNNERVSDRYHTGWGFSCLLDRHVLFDTGEKWEYLEGNMKKKRVDLSRIDVVFISHDHWDHTGGLWTLLDKRPNLRVIGCQGFSDEFKSKVLEHGGRFEPAEDWSSVADDMVSTGELPCQYKGSYLAEHSLIVRTDKGITIVAGCCHPGVVTIVEKVRERFLTEPVHLLFGGFHLMERPGREIELIARQLKYLGVKNVAPTHCTGGEAQAILAEAYGTSYATAKTGESFEI